MMIGFTCPNCGADLSQDPLPIELSGWDDDLFCGLLYIDVTCRECKAEFTNVYKFASQEITYNGD